MGHSIRLCGVWVLMGVGNGFLFDNFYLVFIIGMVTDFAVSDELQRTGHHWVGIFVHKRPDDDVG